MFDAPSGNVTVGADGATARGGMQFAMFTAFTLSGGTITLAGASQTDNTVRVDDFSTATIAAPIAGTAGLIKSGPGELVLSAAGSLSGNAKVAEGTLRVSQAAALGTASASASGGTLAIGVDATLGATLVDQGGRLVLDAPDTRQVSVGSLTVDRSGSGAVVDVGVGRIQIAAGSDATAIRENLLAGRGGDGNWTGSAGITSSAAASSNGTRTVGYLVAADGSALLAFAAPGDVNLDGQVNTLDLVAMTSAGKFGTGAAAVWSEGDFNYDGVVNGLDLEAITGSGAWGIGNYLPLPIASVAVIPEPGTAGLMGAALLIAGVAAGRRSRRAPRRRRWARLPSHNSLGIGSPPMKKTACP